MTPADTARRLADLKSKLASRIDFEGKVLAGYKRNVAAIQAEIARLSAPAPADTSPRKTSNEPAAPVVTAGFVPKTQARPTFKPPVDNPAS